MSMGIVDVSSISMLFVKFEYILNNYLGNHSYSTFGAICIFFTYSSPIILMLSISFEDRCKRGRIMGLFKLVSQSRLHFRFCMWLLTYINLNTNKITDNEAQHLVNALKANTSFTLKLIVVVLQRFNLSHEQHMIG